VLAGIVAIEGIALAVIPLTLHQVYLGLAIGVTTSGAFLAFWAAQPRVSRMSRLVFKKARYEFMFVLAVAVIVGLTKFLVWSPPPTEGVLAACRANAAVLQADANFTSGTAFDPEMRRAGEIARLLNDLQDRVRDLIQETIRSGNQELAGLGSRLKSAAEAYKVAEPLSPAQLAAGEAGNQVIVEISTACLTLAPEVAHRFSGFGVEVQGDPPGDLTTCRHLQYFYDVLADLQKPEKARPDGLSDDDASQVVSIILDDLDERTQQSSTNVALKARAIVAAYSQPMARPDPSVNLALVEQEVAKACAAIGSPITFPPR
jgi:hypothetical protein